MHVCFVLYVYIIQAHRTRYMSHPSHMAIHKIKNECDLPGSTKLNFKTESKSC